jgi:hypothetical protein
MIREARNVFYVLIQSRNSRTKDNVYEGSKAGSALIQRLLSLGTSSLEDEALSSTLAAIKEEWMCNDKEVLIQQQKDAIYAIKKGVVTTRIVSRIVQ